MLEIREQTPTRVVIGAKGLSTLARIEIEQGLRGLQDIVTIRVLGLRGDEVRVETHVSMSESRMD